MLAAVHNSTGSGLRPTSGSSGGWRPPAPARGADAPALRAAHGPHRVPQHGVALRRQPPLQRLHLGLERQQRKGARCLRVALGLRALRAPGLRGRRRQVPRAGSGGLHEPLIAGGLDLSSGSPEAGTWEAKSRVFCRHCRAR